MTDRPAAELLAEYDDNIRNYGRPQKTFADAYVRQVLERLARAEQALADIEELHVLGWDEFCGCCGWEFPCLTVRSARASQGGQT